MNELGRVSAVRLVKVPPFSVLVVNGSTFPAGPAWTDADTAVACSTDITRYHVQLVKEMCSLQDGIHYLPAFKTEFLRPPYTNQHDLDP